MNDAERIDALEAEIKKLKSCPQAGPGLAARTDKEEAVKPIYGIDPQLFLLHIKVFAGGFVCGMLFWILVMR
jgi:hypothetical protein